MCTVYGQRSVGDTVMQVEDDPTMVLMGVPFVACDAFRIPEPGSSELPPVGTSIRVQERGYGLCPCCRAYQPQVRGSGIGAIECRASGRFLVYRYDERAPALLAAEPTE